METKNFKEVQKSILDALSDGAYLSSISSAFDLTEQEVEEAFVYTEKAKEIKDLEGKCSLLTWILDEVLN